MNPEFEHLGEWLRYWRKQSGYTQAALGEAVGVSKQHISNLERRQQHGTSGAESNASIELLDKLSRLFKRSIREARILAGYERQNHIDTVEEALNSVMFFDQKGLNESERQEIRPLLEIADREIERIVSRPTHRQPSKVLASKTQSTARKRDKIDEAIDAALGFMGKPVSEADRKRIREIIEKRSAGKSDEDE